MFHQLASAGKWFRRPQATFGSGSKVVPGHWLRSRCDSKKNLAPRTRLTRRFFLSFSKTGQSLLINKKEKHSLIRTSGFATVHPRALGCKSGSHGSGHHASSRVGSQGNAVKCRRRLVLHHPQGLVQTHSRTNDCAEPDHASVLQSFVSCSRTSDQTHEADMFC